MDTRKLRVTEAGAYESLGFSFGAGFGLHVPWSKRLSLGAGLNFNVTHGSADFDEPTEQTGSSRLVQPSFKLQVVTF